MHSKSSSSAHIIILILFHRILWLSCLTIVLTKYSILDIVLLNYYEGPLLWSTRNQRRLSWGHGAVWFRSVHSPQRSLCLHELLSSAANELDLEPSTSEIDLSAHTIYPDQSMESPANKHHFERRQLASILRKKRHDDNKNNNIICLMSIAGFRVWSIIWTGPLWSRGGLSVAEEE